MVVLAWQCYHLEVTDNAAPGEPGHLHGHVLHLLSDVALAETISFTITCRPQWIWNDLESVDHVAIPLSP